MKNIAVPAIMLIIVRKCCLTLMKQSWLFTVVSIEQPSSLLSTWLVVHPFSCHSWFESAGATQWSAQGGWWVYSLPDKLHETPQNTSQSLNEGLKEKILTEQLIVGPNFSVTILCVPSKIPQKIYMWLRYCNNIVTLPELNS